MPARVTNVQTIFDEINAEIPRAFDQAQNSIANHQKNIIALYKLHSKAALQTESAHNGRNVKLVGERRFEDTFLYMVATILPLKKGPSPADRIVKFVGGYIKFINEKASETQNPHEDDDSGTTAGRFTARLLKFLLQGFGAKDKNVRFRVAQVVAEMISHLGELEEDLYTDLRARLLDRVNDKESTIRTQAIMALVKLIGTEDEVSPGEKTILEIITDALAYDPAPEVRRAALCNLPLNKDTLPFILDRTRDVDTNVRKLVYSHALSKNALIECEDDLQMMGPSHPRALTIAQRELIVRNGLGDREPIVRQATGKLLVTWIESVTEKIVAKLEEGEAKIEDERAVAHVHGGVVALLKLFDLGEGTVAEQALLSVFVTMPQIFDSLEFGDVYWTSLTPETAFLARVFVEHCHETKDEARLEAVLPVVTSLAFRIQHTYNDLQDAIQAEEEEHLVRDPNGIDDEEQIRKEEEMMDKEFVLSEMIKLAVWLDYADEIGRRKMFQLVRDMLSRDMLPETLVSPCLDVLRKLSAGERDLIRVGTEIIADLRDPGDEDDDHPVKQDDDAETQVNETPVTSRPARVPLFNRRPETLSPVEKAKSDTMDLRSLQICIGMLERVNGSFDENSTLNGVVNDLVIPSMKRKEVLFREKGLVALGLCSLIARSTAAQSFNLFVNQLQGSPEQLKIRVLQILFDILMVNEHDFLGKKDENADKIVNFLLDRLNKERCEAVQALLCIGLAKLVLAGMITDIRVLQNLIMAFFGPATVDNQELRQCLSYFFPVFCYSSSANQHQLRQTFLSVFREISQMHKELADDEEMVTLAQIGTIYVDWTDPLKAFEVRGKDVDDAIQVDMAVDIVRELFEQDMDKEDKKVLCQILGKLHMPEVVDDVKIRSLKLLMHGLSSRRPLNDTTSKNAFNKFDATISKKYEKQLEGFGEEEYRKLEELNELFAFLDDVVPDDDEVIEIDPPKLKGRKRRSGSMLSATSDGDGASAASEKPAKRKGKSKRRRLSQSDDDTDDDDIKEIAPPSLQTKTEPRRTMPRRAAALKRKEVIEISSDSDEDATPVPKKGRIKNRRVKEEAEIDAEINKMLDEGQTEEMPFDSIMDDSEGEEDEVNDLILGEGDD